MFPIKASGQPAAMASQIIAPVVALTIIVGINTFMPSAPPAIPIGSPTALTIIQAIAPAC